MRRQDAFGIERPSSVDRIVPRITPPEGGDLYKPVRIPRPFLGARSVVYDIQDQTVTYTSDNARTFPRNFGETRGFSDFTYLSDLTPPSEQRPSPPLRTRTTVNQLQTATEVPTVIPRAHGRDRTVISPPQELHHSAEPPLRNPITAVDLARPTAIVSAAPLSSLVVAEAESVESIDESIRGVQMRALHRNSSLMYQRFTFSLTKFPAIVLVLMALWTLWGRGEGLLKDFRPKEEKGADIAALVTGGFLLISQVFLLHQHCNSYKKAKIMSYLYHITMLLSFCGAAVALVFAAISLKKVKDVNYNDLHFNCKVANISDPDHPNVPHPWLCLTKNQRIDYMGVVIGSSAFVMILAVFTMIAGAIGQFVMADRLASEYQKFVVNNVTPDDEENDHF